MNDLEAIDKLCERFFADTSHDARNGAAQDLARAVPNLAAEIRRLRAENAKLPALLQAPNAEWSTYYLWHVHCQRIREFTSHRVHADGMNEAEAVARWNRLVGKRRAKK